MARAYPQSDYADARDTGAGDWQALRGELVALLDQVESRFGGAEGGRSSTGGVSSRVRQLREQVSAPDSSNRRREALRTVKRAVDRFSTQDETEQDEDDLASAIAQIRSRQGATTIAAIDRRPSDMPEFRELSQLVSGIGDRLGRLEGQLRGARSGAQEVNEIAGQVEQLTQVVELLAGAVGETGQVKRLESQIAALGAMIERGPKVDLGTVNARLDDVSNTVAKLAELQAQQMEREILREDRAEARQEAGASETIKPAMQAIEANVRNVYDRMDAIERNMSISGGEFERLSNQMASVTQAIRDTSDQPEVLISRIDQLADHLRSLDGGDANVNALKGDIASLQQSVLRSMEPRFQRLETQIEALSTKVVPVDTSAVESQLKRLMERMDEAGSQLDSLTRLYQNSGERPDFESLATMVAERTSDAMSRKAAAPVAMFGPESLKTIEDRISSLVRSVSKGPDAETLANLVAEKTSAAVVKSGTPAPAFNPDGFEALEKRMLAVFNTAGKDTAERLARLETALASRAANTTPAAAAPSAASVAMAQAQPAARVSVPEPDAEPTARLDKILDSLNGTRRNDAMPTNPGDEAPLVDRGFEAPKPATAPAPAPRVEAPKPRIVADERPAFDPDKVDRPPRPQSSFAAEKESFAVPPRRAEEVPVVEAPTSSTSTFVAAARRAQRARQEQDVAQPDAGNSLIGRALARVRPQAKAVEAEVEPVKADPKPKAEPRKTRKPRAEAQVVAPEAEEGAEPKASFLVRYRRPLLLGAALVVVSMLTLNLVLQRLSSQRAAPANVETSEQAPATAPAPAAIPVDPVPAEQVSELVAPRVIDMVDYAAAGSINPGKPMSFATDSETTPMPPALFAPVDAAETSAAEIAPLDAEAAASAPEQFELPPEELGPLPLRQAAADGDARAQFEVAAILTEGQTVPADVEEAAKWYERSAAQGFVPAQYRLGNIYESGTGVEKDLEVARLWYQRAAEAGNRMAMHNLAALYAGGALGEQKFEPAAEWFQQAAARGMTDSQFNLGMLYARGLGIEQDFEQSYKWFSLAARSGDTDAAKARDDIAKSLSAEAVNRLAAEVGTWKSEPITLEANFAPIGTWMENFDPGETISNKEVIARVQQVLSRLGFDVGTPDGVAGPKTAEAVKSFERDTGMTEIGKINPRLLAVLGSQPV